MSRGKALIVVGKAMIYALLVAVMAGCVSGRPTHESRVAMIDGFNLTTSDRQTLERRAAKGEAQAASNLGNFYALVLCDESAALHWYKRAAALGGKQERETYESYMSASRSDDE